MPKKVTTGQLVEEFLAWCEPRRAASTVRHYQSRLRTFVDRFGKKKFEKIKPLELQKHFDKVNAGKAPDTQRSNIVVFETFQKWLIKNGLLKKKIVDKLEKPAGQQRKRIPTDEETAAILEAGSPAFRLIYRALRQCGARPNELCRATVENIDTENGVIVLHEHKTAKKTGRPRRIGIGEKLKAIIDESLSGRTTGPLFLSPHGKQWTPANLSGHYRKIRDKLGLPKDLVLYLARHEHATKICDAKGVHAASEALGHANIKTTMRYIKADDKRMKTNQDLFD